MSRELVLGSVHHYDWVQLAGAIQHPDKGKVINMDQATANMTGVKDAKVTVYPVDGYGNEDLLFTIIDREKPDFIMHFTDPRFWGWLYSIERQIRSKIPLTYLNIWDDIPYPMYNRPYYESCDLLMSISQQTFNINRQVMGEDNCCLVGDPNRNRRTIVHYVPHGINPKVFQPIPDDDSLMVKRRKDLFNGKEYDYIIFYNSRNVQRKRTSNIMLAYRSFCDNLPKEEAAKCCLMLHTEVRQEAGTDLLAVKEAFCPDYDVVFSPNKITPEDMCILYNMADVTINLSSNEGFGLSTAESLMCGTPIIVNVTGGLQDQIGQMDDEGKPVVLSRTFGSNNTGKYKKHGPWSFPCYPAVRGIQGSIPTPYIFDDLAKWEDAAEGMMYWYLMGRKRRKAAGMKGRQWAMGDGGLNAPNMCKQLMDSIDYAMETHQPVKQFGVFTDKDYVGNTMPGSLGFDFPTIDKEKLEEKAKSLGV